MTKRLEGRVAIVNGAGSSGPGWGNGKASAVQFAREGAKVILADINRAAAQETADIIAEDGGRAIVVEADAASEADMKRLVAAGLKEFGRLDILLHIVGIAGPGDFFTETEASWDHVFAVNLKSALLASRAAVIPMLEQKWGRIVTISSITGRRFVGKGMSYSYGVSKAAVVHLTQLMALAFADRGIRCNCITLGMMDTPMVRGAFGANAAAITAARDAGSPTGKQGTGWDTAHLAAFLASEEANYINGAEITLDGGFIAGVPLIYGK